MDLNTIYSCYCQPLLGIETPQYFMLEDPLTALIALTATFINKRRLFRSSIDRHPYSLRACWLQNPLILHWLLTFFFFCLIRFDCHWQSRTLSPSRTVIISIQMNSVINKARAVHTKAIVAPFHTKQNSQFSEKSCDGVCLSRGWDSGWSWCWCWRFG